MHISHTLHNTADRKPNFHLRCFFISLLGLLAICGASSAAVMPDYTPLSPIADIIGGPISVSLDRESNLYVVESGTERVTVFSQNGIHIASLTGLETPVSVAVDGSGRIFVGNKEKGSVEVYGADFTPLFKLGAGDGEFAWPNDIAIDASGRIYVADRGRDIVRHYDSAGRLTGSIGASGNNSGQFNRPVSVTIDEAADEVIILDRQLVAGTAKQGARIQFFSMDGEFLHGFSRNGGQPGGMVTPQGITVDTESRIYVTDSYQNAVLVYDNSGNFLDALYDLNNPLRSPLGITTDKNNRLYIASRMANSIEVYGLDQYTGMEVDPITIELTAREGGFESSSREITLRNTGTVTFNWGAVADEEWLILRENTGFLEPGQLATLLVTVDDTVFTPGQYSGNIAVSTGYGASEVIRVILTVEPSAILSVTSTGLALTAEAGSAPAPATMTIANYGSEPLSWAASADKPWITLSESSGILADSESEPATVTVSADVLSLAPGTYSGTITVTGENALASPMTFNASLTLTDHPVVDPPAPEDRILGEMTWESRETIPPIPLNSIWTGSESQVYAVGQGGIILHYNGNEWVVMDSGTQKDLHAVWGALGSAGETIDVYAAGSEGTILHYGGPDGTWTVMPNSGSDLTGLWGSSATDVYAVGRNGTILHYSGIWTPMTSPTGRDLYGIWGDSAADIYAVGQRGTILHYNGATWIEVDSSTRNNLYGVWGTSENKIYAVGQRGTIVRENGSGWHKIDSGTRSNLHGIMGSSDTDIYAIGSNGTILCYDGKAWNAMQAPVSRELLGISGDIENGMYVAGEALTLLHYDYLNWKLVILLSSTEDLHDVWGASPNDVYAVGIAGSILQYDRGEWIEMESPVTEYLYGISGRSANEIYAVGTGGTILHYSDAAWTPFIPSPTDKTLYGVWASAGTDAFAVGQRGSIIHYDGEHWNAIKHKGKDHLFGVWGRSANDVFMVGQNGTILRYDGITVSTMASPTGDDLYTIWGCPENTLFAVGETGTFLRYGQDTGWVSLETGIDSNLSGVWCSSASDVFAVGQNGMLLYYDGMKFQTVATGTEGRLNDIWGSMIATDIFAVGADGIIYHGR